ncbi:MAG: hypothetical protein VKK04_00835 [Synechococcales bacterium]|nr:hypothetical protein [Synechococcales bacterium]
MFLLILGEDGRLIEISGDRPGLFPAYRPWANRIPRYTLGWVNALACYSTGLFRHRYGDTACADSLHQGCQIGRRE